MHYFKDCNPQDISIDTGEAIKIPVLGMTIYQGIDLRCLGTITFDQFRCETSNKSLIESKCFFIAVALSLICVRYRDAIFAINLLDGDPNNLFVGCRQILADVVSSDWQFAMSSIYQNGQLH